MYFIEACSIHGAKMVPLFDRLPIYAYLTALLRDPSHLVSHKQLALQLTSLLLQDTRYHAHLISPATAVLREAVRMMVEPPKHRPSYE